MDSRQVYRGMDIGTDKVSLTDRARAPHHGLDLLDPDEAYSAGRFGRDARRWITDIRARGEIPILAGGTGFFLRALTHPMFREPPLDRERQVALRRVLSRRTEVELVRWLERLDPERSSAVEAGGHQRLSRAVEIATLTGRPLSWWHAHGDPEHPPEPGVVVVLELPRERLDENIGRRADRMVERGLLDEVATLLGAGYHRDDPGMTGTGYREMVDHLEGRAPLPEAMAAMTLQTRQYARRQLTWMRRQLPHAHRVDATRPLDRQVDAVVAIWKASGARTGVEASHA